jgi:hypothetical protein
VGLSTLERDALDGRLEIHVVVDDADQAHCLRAAAPVPAGRGSPFSC